MKTTFKTDEIAHIWAHKSAPHGKAPSALSFVGDTIQSYGTAIARHFERAGKPCVIVNETSYSVTTTRHQSRVRRALSGAAPEFVIGDIGRGCSLNFSGEEGKRLFEYSVGQAARYSAKSEKCRGEVSRSANEATAARYLEQARAVNEFFGLRRKVDTDSIRRLRESSAKSERTAKKARELRDVKERAEQAQAFEAWKLGDKNGYFSAHNFPVAFRVEGDDLVSTLGARVPVAAARVAVRFALNHREAGWHRNGESCQVGNYELDAINPQGIVAGCHRIAWDEVERIATLLAAA